MVGQDRTPVRPMNSQSRLRRASSFLGKLIFWRKEPRPPTVKQRVVVPNHLFSSPPPPSSSDPAAVHPSTADPTQQNPNRGYMGNRIRTTKYTLLTFLPKNLFEQFHRFANLYFLFIVLLNWVPQINAFGKEIAMIPVVFVLGVTAIKDIFEDRRRYKSDKRINNSTCRVYSAEASRYVKTLWKSVLVGDVVHLSCNEIIPADILLLRSSDDQGLCYLETANLDGESNLKQRQVIKGMLAQRDEFVPTKFKSTIECDLPNNKIYRFHGSIIHPDGERVAINKDNLLLRDCVIKNTDFIEGIVVYAGHETKAMLNNGGPRYKRSKLERRMNWDVLWCVVILIVLCFIGAIGYGLWLSSYNIQIEVPFIPNTDGINPPYEGFLAFWTFVIILQVMIPLSLYVSIEIIKLGQVYHIHNDIELFDSASNKRLECRALNIPEELGQVEYIFSDKTGTLTENNMIFRRCTIGGVDYNHHHPSIAEGASADAYSVKVTRDDAHFVLNSRLTEELSQMDMQIIVNPERQNVQLSQQSQCIQDFFLLLTVCNTVVVSKHPHQDKMNASGLYLDSGSNTLNGFDSPDVHYKPMNNYLGAHLNPQFKERSSPSPYTSTPLTLKKKRLLTLPGLCNGRAGSPTPSPGELRPIYEAESPDELALVNAAYQYNCRLLKRLPESVTLALPGEGLIEFPIVHVLPFDPTRKRMSVILQHPFTKEKILYCKGADSSIFSRLATPQDEETKQMIFRTQQHLNTYAKKGLRILVMAKRVLTEEEYSAWAVRHKDAEFAVEDRDQKMLESAHRIEQNLELLGATGIEDRLQEGVPETIAALRQAGIVVWVLTGDKQETAVNIAYSCRLFSYDMEIISLNARSRDTALETIKFHLEQLRRDTSTRQTLSASALYSSSTRNSSHAKRLGLVIDGRTLAYVLDKDLQLPFLELAQHCSAVLCCRATPIQKATVVKQVKEHLHVLTLAIGDGANDVSMIQTADVGIGISGQEGMQAVMASDFAMARFRYLERLLLVHGHWCYDRLARMVLYFFYKNAGIIFLVFWYQLYCGFSGMVMIDQLNIMLYNLFFTSLPPLVIGIYDQDAPSDLLLSRPDLYSQGRLSKIYKSYSFWVNIADALYQSIIIFFIPMLTYEDSSVDIWEFGTTVTTCCLVVQLLHLCIETKSWTPLHLFALVLSVVIYFAFDLAYNSICTNCHSLPNPYWVMQHCMGTAIFWLNILIVSVAGILPRLVIRMLQTSLRPSEIIRALLEYRAEESIPEQTQFSVSWSRSTSVSSFVRVGEPTYGHYSRGVLTEVA